MNKSSNIKKSLSRRKLLKGFAGIPFLALLGRPALKNPADPDRDVASETTINSGFEQLKNLKGKLPEGKIGNLSITRMIMGCNLIGGWAHARDLIYANNLFKKYHSEEKIIETLSLAEQAGINTAFMVTGYYPVFNKYKNLHNGKMQSICQTMLPDNDFFSNIKLAIDSGATALYIQGGEGDRYMSSGKSNMIFKAIDYIKKQGFLAGIGAHSIESIKVCEKENIPVDFYVKTLHHDRYWSAHPVGNRTEYSIIRDYESDHNKFHDNIWDLFPSNTIEYMKNVKKPWIAFKVLAAGAIEPKDGFSYAFENGADFICVGMFDFQVIEDVNTAFEVLSTLKPRERQWFS
ncbi:MAG: hypothetical protein HPY62_03650 [Bacteroidales bacterium]|nr:hypothetical protein [Bacteroidales bacterium]